MLRSSIIALLGYVRKIGKGLATRLGMSGLRWFIVVCLIGSRFLLTGAVLWAEAGVLVVHVKDAERHPISGVQIGVEGDGGSSITGDDGKARIPLAKQTKDKSWVSLQILKSPPGKDFVMVSPWDPRTMVPSFENESENFVEVVVVQRGDRVLLESGTLLAALTAKINKKNAQENAGKGTPQEDSKANLAAVAKQYGLTPTELDQAIQAWGAKTTDLQEEGQAALYARNYPKASEAFTKSLQEREKKLAADQTGVAESAYFLGRALFEEGRYRESATAYQRCLQLRPDDIEVLNMFSLSLIEGGDYQAAEPLLRHMLDLNVKSLGPENTFVSIALNNLGTLLRREHKYEAAEEVYRRALAINEKILGPNHTYVAMNLINLGSLQMAKDDYEAAEPLYQRALEIFENALGPDSPDVAVALNNVGTVLKAKGDYEGARKAYQRGLAINEKVLGSGNPQTQSIRQNLDSLNGKGPTQIPEK